MNFSDRHLLDEMDAIQREAKDRQSKNMPFAHWVMQEQLSAIQRFQARETIGATSSAQSGE